MLRPSLVKCVVALVFICSASAVFAQMPNPYGSVGQSGDGQESSGASAGRRREKTTGTMAVAYRGYRRQSRLFRKNGRNAVGQPQYRDWEGARAAAQFKRPTKALEDALAAGGDGLRILGLPGAVPVEGGIPLVSEGKIVGAIGVSGGASSQDAQCAKAGADLMK